MNPMVIVLDLGHGGRDPGAVGSGLQEKDVVLTLGRQVLSFLEDYQVKVIPTRTSDVYVSLDARANLANHHKADFFCSLHVNSGGGSGFESYIHPDASQESQSMANTLHREVAKFYLGRGFPDRGLKRANFAVLRKTTMPAVLLENLFIDNPQDAACLADAVFLRDLAFAITGGLARALGLKKRTGWDPGEEIKRLKERGLITGDHAPNAAVTWGELATVLNRLLDRIEK
ncbi:N-acetylmuramoyl-L-alanine amidase [Desulfofundulus sp. TPOSR]|nr:N-acetylmuramoyl-L-alanine amidase [Desulfofundulus sp. TPOSR]